MSSGESTHATCDRRSSRSAANLRRGKVLVGETRVPIDTVVLQFRSGATPEEIVDRFPTLAIADVYAVIVYYLDHRREVDEDLTEEERLAAEVRAETESRFRPIGLRERLLARQRDRRQGNGDT